jgi:NAD(P)H-dependent FMN reductase
VNDNPAVICHLCRPATPVCGVLAALYEIEAFQLGELAADGRMIAPHQIGKFRDAQRTSRTEAHEQGKQSTVEADASFAEQGIVALGAVQEAHEVHKGGPQAIQTTCILHLYVTSHRLYIRCMIHVPRIQVIVSSVRARRICPQIAAWVAEIGADAISGRFEVVDLKDWPLPMDDETEIPAGASNYAFEHTSAWSRKVSEGDAFVFVTPQYNWGYPATLKNALDHLYREWVGKPAMIVTYGGHGGGKCAAQLRQVLDGLKMQPVPTMPGFRLARERIEANTGTIEPASEFAEYLDVLRQAFVELSASLASVPSNLG